MKVSPSPSWGQSRGGRHMQHNDSSGNDRSQMLYITTVNPFTVSPLLLPAKLECTLVVPDTGELSTGYGKFTAGGEKVGIDRGLASLFAAPVPFIYT